MNNRALDQKSPVNSDKAVNTTTKVQRKKHTSIPKGSILERLMDFAFSIPDFRRTDSGNIRHGLGDIIMLMIFARMSKCAGRADIIEFGKHNLRKLQSIGLLNNGVPSELHCAGLRTKLMSRDLPDKWPHSANRSTMNF